ncbi:MAG: NAD(P)H-hydrate dehydratase [Bacteroidetes bacterium]|nr:MAG: NAD(P)H-hydrate dehydratase [Bacteroidota bacterium]
MKVLSVEQIRALDAFTIANEPIPSLELMERASRVFTHWFINIFPDEDVPVTIFCGPGNNGGDGLAVARLLHDKFYTVKVVFCAIGNSTSEDFKANLDRLPAKIKTDLVKLKKGDKLPVIAKESIIIDAIFGSGLSRPVEGFWGEVINYLNSQTNPLVSIDVPSGLFADRHSNGSIIKADHTLSFELPKFGFFFAENHEFTGEWDFQSIGLSYEFIDSASTSNYYLTKKDIQLLLNPLKKFDHKGTFGHALLVMGSYGKIGAATLAAKACLRTGCGLVTVHLPKCGYEILQTAAPEIMVSIDEGENYIENPPNPENYASIGAGCGIGTTPETAKALQKLISENDHPVLLDADALNILAANKQWLRELPQGSILTPHPGEFRRLFDGYANNFEQNEIQRQMAQELNVFIVLKGAHTCIADPEGNCYFNSTGNPGMATAGSGDVLSGMITSFLAQGYPPKSAAILGVYLHGLAGDIAADQQDPKSLIASDIINAIGPAFKTIKN